MMNAFLAEHYGTDKTASAQNEDLQKEAMVDLFVKTAAAEGINLDDYTAEQQVEAFENWTAAQSKVAESEEKKDEEEHDAAKRLEKAREEHEDKKASALAFEEKVAEADFCGRVIAHAFHQENKKIAAAEAAGETIEMPKEAAMPAHLRAALEAKGKGAMKGGLAKAEGHGRKGMAGASSTAHSAAARGKDVDKAVGGHKGGNVPNFMKKKKASALDSLAAEHAVVLAQHAGLDAEEAGRKVAAVLELNLAPDENSKTASAADIETAIPVRALEFLEAAGYPVDWSQV